MQRVARDRTHRIRSCERRALPTHVQAGAWDPANMFGSGSRKRDAPERPLPTATAPLPLPAHTCTAAASSVPSAPIADSGFAIPSWCVRPQQPCSAVLLVVRGEETLQVGYCYDDDCDHYYYYDDDDDDDD